MQKLFKILLLAISLTSAIYASQPREFSGIPSELPTISLPLLTRPTAQHPHDPLILEFTVNQNEEQQTGASTNGPSSKKRRLEESAKTDTQDVRIKIENQEQQSEQPVIPREIVYYVLSTDQITRQHLESIANRQHVTHLRVVLGEKVKERRGKPKKPFVTALTAPQINILNEYFPNVVNLNLSNLGEFGIGATTALANSFRNLTHLNLANTYIYNTGLGSLLQAVFVPNLLGLNIYNTGITVSGLSDLLISRLNRLQELDVSSNTRIKPEVIR